MWWNMIIKVIYLKISINFNLNVNFEKINIRINRTLSSVRDNVVANGDFPNRFCQFH